MQKIEFRAMGCNIAAIVDNNEPQAAQALEQVPSWFEEWEQALSRFRPDSDLSRCNASIGVPFKAGVVLWDVITAALCVAQWTDGLVVPTILKPLKQAGYDRSFELLPITWSSLRKTRGFEFGGEEEDRPGNASWQNIHIDESNRQITLFEGCEIDLGGIAKGWAARQAAKRLAEFGPALVDAGGDIGVSGSMVDGSPWIIEVADPLHMQTNLGLLGLQCGGVATSGVDYRRWLMDGNWKHHIIDPRTCQPAETDLISVTIISADITLAEAAAKMVMILGSQAGLAWLEDQPGLHGLLAIQDGRLILSSGIQDYLLR